VFPDSVVVLDDGSVPGSLAVGGSVHGITRPPALLSAMRRLPRSLRTIARSRMNLSSPESLRVEFRRPVFGVIGTSAAAVAGSEVAHEPSDRAMAG
jgi:hypothetical protein